MPHSSDPRVRLPLLSSPTFLVIFAVVVLVAIGGAFWIGSGLRSPEASAVAAASTTVPVKTKVEERVVSDQVLIPGSVQPGQTYSVLAVPADGTSRNVVTSMNLSVGEEAGIGQMIGTVSGQPLFIIDERVPLYRDLKLGDEGPDVAELQTALANMGYPVTKTSKVDTATIKAVEKIYTFFDQSMPKVDGTSRIKFSHFVSIPGNKGTITAITPVGKNLGPEDAVVSLQISGNLVVARASLLEADRLSVGLPVTIRLGTGKTIPGTVLSIGPFIDGGTEANKEPGKDVTVGAVDEHSSELQPKQAVTIASTTADVPSLAVPVVAIHQDAEGEFVLLEQSGQSEGSIVRIQTVAEQDGWAKIDKTSGLKPGDVLLVQ